MHNGSTPSRKFLESIAKFSHLVIKTKMLVKPLSDCILLARIFLIFGGVVGWRRCGDDQLPCPFLLGCKGYERRKGRNR